MKDDTASLGMQGAGETPRPLGANVERFSGFADQYDRYRPRPPEVLVDLLTQQAGGKRPQLVVDIGSGTGLSTTIWAGRAAEVVGIEPNPEMRAVAEQRLGSHPGAGVRFQAGLSTDTGLPDGTADIVTCSQCLHWLEPEPTFAEIARILRPGGVFAAYDCDWPPAIHWEVEEEYVRFVREAEALGEARGYYPGVRKWAKEDHLARMEESGQFRWTREVTLHHVEPGDAGRLVGVALSQGGVATLLKRGLTEAEIGVPRLRDAASRILGSRTVSWYWSYRVRLGVK